MSSAFTSSGTALIRRCPTSSIKHFQRFAFRVGETVANSAFTFSPGNAASAALAACDKFGIVVGGDFEQGGNGDASPIRPTTLNCCEPDLLVAAAGRIAIRRAASSRRRDRPGRSQLTQLVGRRRGQFCGQSASTTSRPGSSRATVRSKSQIAVLIRRLQLFDQAVEFPARRGR